MKSNKLSNESMEGKFVAYYRISTDKTGGLNSYGIEAQKEIVKNYLDGGQWELLASFEEVESGRNPLRPELQKAIKMCLSEKATLLVGKLDRIARSVAILSKLRESGVKFVCCDMPQVDNFTVTILMACAEREADLISQRTKQGLAIARQRGKKLGGLRSGDGVKRSVEARQAKARAFAKELEPVIEDIKKAFVNPTLQQIADALNRRGYRSIWGRNFYPATVSAVLDLLSSQH